MRQPMQFLNLLKKLTRPQKVF